MAITSTSNPETLTLIEVFVESFLGYTKEAARVWDATKADPGCVYAQACSAALWLFVEIPEARDNARRHLREAREGFERASEHERQFVRAIEAWCGNDVHRACELHESIAKDYPQDLLSVKFCQIHYLNLGRSEALRDIALKVAPHNTGNPYIHALVGFGEVECGNFDEGERLGRAGTNAAPGGREPWAHHCVAHALMERGEVDRGVEWLTDKTDLWSHCNSFMYTHNWWHLALFHLDRDETSKVLDMYDQHVWGIEKGYSQDQCGAVSLLWRLDQRGVNVANRWEDVSAHVAQRRNEHDLPFTDLHYTYALTRTAQNARLVDLLSSMDVNAHYAERQTEVAIPVARAIDLSVRGQHDEAYELWSPIYERTREIGGSNAQRDIFHLAYLDILIASERFDEALPLLEERVKLFNRKSPYIWNKLALVSERCGKGEAIVEQYRQKAIDAVAHLRE